MEYFGCPKTNNELFDSLPNLKVVSTVSAGYDHLDRDTIRTRGIRIGHTPGGVAEATADMARELNLFCREISELFLTHS